MQAKQDIDSDGNGARPPRANTREALIRAAEQLFAEAGIDGVSLRQINVAAGQKNSSAAHYHFGSKDALVMAVYEFRMERVNRRRLEYLEKLRTSGRETEVRALVEATVLPIVEEMHDGNDDGCYIRFLAQVMGHPRVQGSSAWSGQHAGGMSTVIQFLQQTLPELPRRLLLQRIGFMWELIIHSLADQARNRSPAGTPSWDGQYVNNLVDTVAGGLMAPVSPAATGTTQR